MRLKNLGVLLRRGAHGLHVFRLIVGWLEVLKRGFVK
jgi:hypothetical protein